MKRVPVLSVMFAVGLTAATMESTSSGTLSITLPADNAHAVEVAAIAAPLAESFGLEPGVRLKRGMRDAMHDTLDRVEGWFARMGEASGVKIPDVSVLTAEPLSTLESSSGFGWREDPFRGHRKFHHGADLRGKHGTPVVAAGDGVVTLAGPYQGYGNVVFIDHGGGVVTRYAHLRKIEIKKFQAVTAGQRIGQVGSTGHTTGPHLHFEVRLDGYSVNPVTAYAVAERWRESPSAGRVAAYVLAPRIQQAKQSDDQPSKKSKKESRPERSGREKRVKPVS